MESTYNLSKVITVTPPRSGGEVEFAVRRTSAGQGTHGFRLVAFTSGDLVLRKRVAVDDVEGAQDLWVTPAGGGKFDARAAYPMVEVTDGRFIVPGKGTSLVRPEEDVQTDVTTFADELAAMLGGYILQAKPSGK